MSEKWHGGKGDQVRPGKGYQENYEKTFGPTKSAKGCSLIWCPIAKKMVDKGTEVNPNQSAMVVKPMEAFISPIDRKVISDRGQLRRHNKEHGVTDTRDYSAKTMQKRVEQRHSEVNGSSRTQTKELGQRINEVMRLKGV